MTLAAWCDSPLNCHNLIYFDNPSMYLRQIQENSSQSDPSKDIYFLRIDHLDQITNLAEHILSQPQHIYLAVPSSTKTHGQEVANILEPLRTRAHSIDVLDIPDLKETPEDIEHMLMIQARKQFCPIIVEPGTIDWFKNQAWSGNFRELFDLLHSLFQSANAQGQTSLNLDFCENHWHEFQQSRQRGFIRHLLRSPHLWRELETSQYQDLIAQFDRLLLIKALDECQGVQRRAALALGIPATTLSSRLEKLNSLENTFTRF